MEIKKESLPKSKVKLTIKVSSPEMRGFFSRAYNKLAAGVEVKGFRKGMAPRSLTISAIGENRINSEIVDLALRETYAAALKKENIIPISHPQVNIKMLKDLTMETAELEYEAEVEIMPEVKIGNYKDIEVNKDDKEIKVDKDEIEQVISHLRRQKATFNDIKRPLATGDRTEINFEGFERQVKIENLSSQNYPVILGSGVLLKDFEKNLIGLKKGDKKEFKTEVADPKNPKLPKKSIDFKVEVLSAQEVILPTLDEQFAKGFQKENIDDLKTAIAKDIKKQKEISAKKDLENQVLEGLAKITQVELPVGLINQEIDRGLENLKKQLEMSGMTLEKYLAGLKKTPEEFRQEMRPQAEKSVKFGLALGEIIKAEKIDPKEKEAGHLAIEKLIKYNTK